MLRDMLGAFGQFTPSLNLDFSKGVLPAGVSYSRSGIATRVNSSGLIETIAADVPRFDYDPVTLKCRGILREPISTNRHLSSETALNAYFFTGGGTGDSITANVSAGALGRTTLTRITTGSAARLIRFIGGECGISATNTQYCVSVFYRGALNNLSVAARAGAGVFFTDMGVQTSNGLRRAYSVITSGANAAAFLDITALPNTNVDIGDIQVEQGLTYPTSYIPTTTATVTRNFEALSGPAFGSWYNPVQGTILVDCQSTNFSTPFGVGYFRNATSGDIMPVENNNSARIRNNSGAYIFGVTLNTWPLTTAQRKTVLAYRSGDIALARSGVLVSTSTATDLPTSINQFVLVDANFTGTLAAVKYYPFRLGNSIVTAYSA